MMMQYNGSDLGATMDDPTIKFGFASYCGQDKFAANITYSGLLLNPYDPTTGAPIVGTSQVTSLYYVLQWRRAEYGLRILAQ
jgi:hypothetical protein